jgi:hypothetical protein
MWYLVILSNPNDAPAGRLDCWITAEVSEGDQVDVAEQPLPGSHWQVFRVRRVSSVLPHGAPIYTATKVGA